MIKNWFKRLIQRCFKTQHYLSDIDQFLEKVRQTGLQNTPGYTAKRAYYQRLAKQRDLPPPPFKEEGKQFY